jgi:hypothetical protein
MDGCDRKTYRETYGWIEGHREMGESEYLKLFLMNMDGGQVQFSLKKSKQQI